MRELRWLGLGLGLAGLVLLAGAQSGTDQPGGYHVAQTVTLPGNGGFDYLGIDTPARRVYISAGDAEDVVNADTYAVEGQVTGLKGTHGVAISDKDGHGFTSNGGSNSMTMFDLKTLQTIKEIPLPINGPDGIIYDPATDRIFASNHDRNGMSQAVFVDAKTGDVVGTVKLTGKASEYAVADGRGHVYNNMEDTSQELEIDSKTLKVLHVWPLAPCEGPSGLAMDRQTRRLVVGCHNGMMAIVNADNGKVVTTIPIGPGVDATRFDPGTKLAFSSNGGGRGANAAPATITVAHEDSPDHFTLVGNIPTETGARTMEVDTQTHTLFTVTAKYQPRPAPPEGTPAPEAGRGRGRGPGFMVVPGSFHLLVIPKG
ncbi:MAG: YncE family protein [Terriglobales bacterium]